MPATVRALKRKAAKRPQPRTVTFAVKEGDYAGWQATAKADFPARVLALLQSGNISDVMAAMDAIVLDHNMPDSEDEIAEHMADVDPYEGLLEVAGGLFDELGKLPNR